MRTLVAVISVVGCTATARRPMQLQRVILYQNGIGYFEREGHVGGDTVRLELSRGELDDVLKTLTVIDRLGAGVATVDVPMMKDGDRTVALGVRLSAGRVHDVAVSYAVPTPTWKAAYRVVLDEQKPHGLLQGWAMVNNVSQEDWTGIGLTLATGAPMSFATDLHTPEFVKRPDATGHLVAPTVLGPIDTEKVTAGDRDGDGIVDAVDKCPDAAEDRDGFEDEDGCPDPDQDHDRIPDADDKCPNEPETYNGFEDDDGCPDRGRVLVTSSAIEILEDIFFAPNGDAITGPARPILDAIAATLNGNPDIAKLEIGGHASEDETEVWGLSSRRAAAVRAALIQRGVAADRLDIVPYGATRPLDKTATKNRRVDFIIAQRHDVETVVARAATPVYDVPHALAAVHTASKPADIAGSVRYALSEPVTIRRGAATMVSIVNKPILSEDVLLFRPDANAPGSDRHPFRAVRLVNDSGFTLEPGPIAIFARGSFVGDSLLDRLDLGETAWVPYALEGGTVVTAARSDAEHPVRIVSIHRGVITVENAGVRTTTYKVAAGREPPKQLFVRHDRLAGYVATELPPHSEDRGDSYLVPLPLQAGKTSTLVIEEREPRRRTIQLLDQGTTQLGLYVEGSKLPPPVAQKLAAAIELRKALGALEDDRAQIRTRIGDLAARADELRQSLRALDKVGGAEALRKKIVASLTAVTTDSDAQARALEVKTEDMAAARQKLHDAIRDIELADAP
jgi:outer membrane protein OmpA-like peptidoglycan-associated protein